MFKETGQIFLSVHPILTLTLETITKFPTGMALMQLLFLKTKVPAIPLHYESQIMTKTETNSILTSKTSLATAEALR